MTEAEVPQTEKGSITISYLQDKKEHDVDRGYAECSAAAVNLISK